MIKGMLGKKIEQSQIFDENGKRKTITLIKVGPCFITQIKSEQKDKYSAIQLGFGEAKKISKPQKGLFKKAGLTTTPRFLVEIKQVENGKLKVENGKIKLGQEIKIDKVFKVGDKVKVSGISKGKGFAGVVKRWGFKGGPKTHGQSDRHRAPGSIGQGTTPGRVYKGKKMAGRMGGKRVTVKGLKVLKIDKEKDMASIAGLVPGVKGGLVEIYKY